MKTGNAKARDLESWLQLDHHVTVSKATYMKAFRAAVEKEFSLLCKEHLLAGLWVMESRFGGMGGTYNPVFWWRLSMVENDSLRIQFEVGDGLLLVMGTSNRGNIHETAFPISEFFTPEAGWYRAADCAIRNAYPFGSQEEMANAATEIWLLGNNAEKFAGLLIQTVKPFLTDERVIKLFRS